MSKERKEGKRAPQLALGFSKGASGIAAGARFIPALTLARPET
jgi:hypothetical protein